jgi:hypothetical protein
VYGNRHRRLHITYQRRNLLNTLERRYASLTAPKHCENSDVQAKELRLLVVHGNGPRLLGRDWLHHLKLNWKELFQVRKLPSQSLQPILSRRAAVFKEELGTMRGVAATIYVENGCRPRYFRPRSIPYALRPRVEEELDRLQRMGVIEPVQFSDWAAPIVPMLKKDGSI